MRSILVNLVLLFILTSCVERQSELKPMNQNVSNQRINKQSDTKSANSNHSENITRRNHGMLNFGRVADEFFGKITSGQVTVRTNAGKEIFVVTGWGLAIGPLRPFKEVYVKIGEQEFKTVYGRPAPYLKKVFDDYKIKNPNLNAGFMVPIMKKQVTRGKHKVTLIGVSENGETYESEQSFILEIV